MIKTITVKNFKSIELLKDFELTNLNVLIGANGVGKSVFLQVFSLLQKIALGREIEHDVFIPQIDNTYLSIDFMSPDFEGLRKYECQFFTELAHPDNSLQISYEGSERGHGYQGRQLSVRTRNILSSMTFYDSSFIDNISSIIDDNTTYNDGADLSAYLFYLKNNHVKHYDEIRTYIQIIAPFFDDFIFEKKEMRWRHKKGGGCKLNLLSQGILRFICLATLLHRHVPTSLLILDEPELGLGVTATAVLAEMINSATMNSQLIIATQSPRLIDNFSANDIITVNRKNGKSIFERLDENNFKDWLEDYSLGELWVKNVIEASKVYNEYEE